MTFRLHPLARAELDQAVDYYESCESGLGLAFSTEVYDAIQRIIAFPTAWSRLSARTRRCLTGRFPYGIIYQIENDEIRIVAVSHLHRRPDYWRDRLGAEPRD